ncbi:GntR family transcriptional regulator [Halanaerobium hydrogeniformans]|uniref:Transcriptional regulator, GntR family n=1 Tax=Halanaerobium hydrogeniformans TaxID=656519 RepID=E4RIZ6_HALHG|nr:GntR family transcriptional regulator [Halanaerobium hydrogeniformans]ADQ15216.1 transcriptional regulator, GntR family [Halanaerobium hydrogeniformans]
MFDIELDREGEENLYKQIYQQIKAEILEDRYTPDSKMPSIRKLAARLGVNNETVVKAYDLLAEEFLIYKKEGSGSYIAPAAGYKSNKDDQRLRILSSKESSVNRIIDFSGSQNNREYMPEYAFDLVFDQFYSKFQGNIFKEIDFKSNQWFCFLKDIVDSFEHKALYYNSRSELIMVLELLIQKNDLLLFESPSDLGPFAHFLTIDNEIGEENNFEKPEFLKLKNADYEVLMDYLRENKIDYLILSDEPVFANVLSWSISKLKSLFELAEMLKFKIIIFESYYLFGKNEKIETLLNSSFKNNLILIRELSNKVFPGLDSGVVFLAESNYYEEESNLNKNLLEDKYRSLSAGDQLLENVLSYYLEKSYLNKRTKLLKQRIKNRNLLLKDELHKSFRDIEVKCSQTAFYSILYLEQQLDQKAFNKFSEKTGVLLADYRNFLIDAKSNQVILSTAALDQFSIRQGVVKLAKIYRQYLS